MAILQSLPADSTAVPAVKVHEGPFGSIHALKTLVEELRGLPLRGCPTPNPVTAAEAHALIPAILAQLQPVHPDVLHRIRQHPQGVVAVGEETSIFSIASMLLQGDTALSPTKARRPHRGGASSAHRARWMADAVYATGPGGAALCLWQDGRRAHGARGAGTVSRRPQALPSRRSPDAGRHPRGEPRVLDKAARLLLRVGSHRHRSRRLLGAQLAYARTNGNCPGVFLHPGFWPAAA